MVLSSLSVNEIQQIYDCSEACAKLAMAEAEERRRQEEAEVQERREEREHALKLAQLNAGTLSCRNAFIVMNFITILLLMFIRGRKQTTH